MKHLLVLRFSSMGDVAMMIPSLRCLVKSYPNLKITVVSKKTFKPFFKEFEKCNFFEVGVSKEDAKKGKKVNESKFDCGKNFGRSAARDIEKGTLVVGSEKMRLLEAAVRILAHTH